MATSGPLGGAKIGPHDPPGKTSGPDPTIIYRVRGSRLDSYAFSIPQYAEKIPIEEDEPLVRMLFNLLRIPNGANEGVDFLFVVLLLGKTFLLFDSLLWIPNGDNEGAD
ncbi:hypothetical protein NPIL_356811 [Nephila pilipes]|uniref:Uncharacterized protein n=1 Tax=Nephila pilipes TaxID=299642 RepID=A0A8X6T475_NEPPI|nr:hypothetical protein NPIL_337161 [Nephila pilipes]GFS78526.1 hypothetical protein NPIL_196901 [Nephila pilipes]GFT98479.1 hypothetical protein NPIL_462851 [Nephila pilipes]GFU41255.1 hypothetical protein NPIL_356811 [Nephila pilipes]